MKKECDNCNHADLHIKEEPCNACCKEAERPGGEGFTRWEPINTSALNVQVAGDHYKSLKIQPVEYIHANKLPFIEGCIIKYATRWRDKGGIKDLEKIKHFAELLIELENKNGG